MKGQSEIKGYRAERDHRAQHLLKILYTRGCSPLGRPALELKKGPRNKDGLRRKGLGGNAEKTGFAFLGQRGSSRRCATGQVKLRGLVRKRSTRGYHRAETGKDRGAARTSAKSELDAGSNIEIDCGHNKEIRGVFSLFRIARPAGALCAASNGFSLALLEKIMREKSSNAEGKRTTFIGLRRSHPSEWECSSTIS